MCALNYIVCPMASCPSLSTLLRRGRSSAQGVLLLHHIIITKGDQRHSLKSAGVRSKSNQSFKEFYKQMNSLTLMSLVGVSGTSLLSLRACQAAPPSTLLRWVPEHFGQPQLTSISSVKSVVLPWYRAIAIVLWCGNR